MKTDEMIALALAGIAVFLIFKSTKAGTTIGASYTGTWKADKEILDSNGQRFGNGWRYFDGGVSIDPQGNYYQNNQMIWSPAA